MSIKFYNMKEMVLKFSVDTILIFKIYIVKILHQKYVK